MGFKTYNVKLNIMRKIVWLFALPAFFCFSCNQFDELNTLEGVKYDAAYAVPLVDTRLSMKDLLDQFEQNATLVVGTDGLLRFIYRQEVVQQTSDEVFASINKSLPQVIPIVNNYQALPFSSPNGLQIDRLDFKGGTLSYYMQSSNPQGLVVKATFPQVTKNDVPLVLEANLAAFGNKLDSVNLSGYRIRTLNDSIYVQYEALTPNGTSVKLASFLINLKNLQFTYAEGYFGNFLYEGSRDTLNIDFFDNWVRGDVYFENPRITFNVENSFGIPTRARVNTLNVITVKNEILPLESPYVTNGIDFPYPSMSEMGQVKKSSFSFTKDNSNIANILGAGPVAIDYDVDAVTNPNNDANIRGYITDQSYYKINMEVELPLYGRASGFVTRDTINLDLSSYDEVDNAEFKLVVDNAIPLEVAIQGYFLDANNVIVDSLLTGPQTLVPGAPVDANGAATGTQQKVSFIPFEDARFARIRDNAKRLWLNAAFSTLNNGNTSVRVLNTQDVRIRLGAKLGVKN